MPSSVPPTTALRWLLRSCSTREGGRGAAALGGQQAQVCKCSGSSWRTGGLPACAAAARYIHRPTQRQVGTSTAAEDSPSPPAWQPPCASWSAGCAAARCPAQLCSRQAAAGTAARTAAAPHRGSRLQAEGVTGVQREGRCARAAVQVAGASMHRRPRGGGSGEAAGCGGLRQSLGGTAHLMCSHSARRQAEAHWGMREPCSAARCRGSSTGAGTLACLQG